MAIYKFRITFEDYEDISRDIEIKSSQTFFDFYQIILQSIGFDTKHPGSFFVSDDYWRKYAEITLLEADLEPGVKLMKSAKIASFIEQPNQRFLFLYDKDVRWSLLIELIKLVPEDAKATYPRCVKIIGAAPKQYKQQLIAKLKEEVEKGVEDDKIVDDEVYKAIGEEKIVFDEDEESSLHDDENAETDEENEEGGEDDEHHEDEEQEGGNDAW
ncbi:MAG: hypothetical protein ABI388_09305 [Bacteroidia bacterium]